MSWLEKITENPVRLAVGLMSGTSMDGIDAALVNIQGSGLTTEVSLVDFLCYTYEDFIISELESLESDFSLERLSDLNFKIGENFAKAAIEIVERSGKRLEDIDFIGSHGQTVFHKPPSSELGSFSTLQIGELDVIAERTGITTVGDFRTRDVASFGEGAPLVPYVDFLLFHNFDKIRIAQNIGGIANCTLVAHEVSDVIAFDSGPGNILIDNVVKLATSKERNYDENGDLASKGEVNLPLLYNLLSDPYFKKAPPKSTGREKYGIKKANELFSLVEGNTISLEDILSTLVEFTVDTIFNSYENFVFPKWKVDEVILSGGGAKNSLIVERLRKRLDGIELSFSDSYGVPIDAKEAVAFALLANETIFGNCSNIPAVTGAKASSPIGKIVVGKSS